MVIRGEWFSLASIIISFLRGISEAFMIELLQHTFGTLVGKHQESLVWKQVLNERKWWELLVRKLMKMIHTI